MQQYILNILPRFKAYGKQLNKIEEFADKTWVLAEVNGDIITYRFKRNGVLRKSINGDIHDLQWELEGTDAIAIIDPVSKRGEMFRHGFILDGLLVVQKEGLSTTPIVFFNDSIIKDGDINSYLFDTIIRTGRLKKGKGERVYYYSNQTENSFYNVGADVYDNELRPVVKDEIKLKNKTIYVENGKIKNIVYFKNQQSNKGAITIISNAYMLLDGKISVDDKVVVEADKFYSGKLTLSSKTILTVSNGKVVSVNETMVYLPILVSMIVTGVLIFLLVYFNK